MAWRRLWVPAAALAEAALLFLYYRRSGVWVAPSDWLASFTWRPASGPFEWAPFFGVALTSASAALVFLAWMCLAALIGSALLRRAGWKEDAPDRRLLAAVGLGLGAFSLTFFLLGIAGLYTRPAALLAGLGFLGLCILDERLAARAGGRAAGIGASFSRGADDPRPEGGKHITGAAGSRDPQGAPKESPLAERRGPDAADGALSAFVGGLCLLMLAFHFLGALLPPTSFDEMNYQLALPKLYILHRGFVPTPFNHLSYLPRNMNMLFVLGLLSGGPTTAKLFSLASGVLACAALFAFGRSFLGRRAAFLGAAVFFLVPVVGNQFRVAASDLGTAFYEITAALLFLRWREDRSARTLPLASAFWGLAMGTKYTAIPGFVGSILLLAWTAWEEKMPPGRFLAAAAAYVLPAAVLWAPWPIKNWLDSGNPVDPILSTVIRSRNFVFAGQYKPLVDYTVGLGIVNYFPIRGLRDLLLLPWHLVSQHNDFNHDLGPVWLLCAPPAALLALPPEPDRAGEERLSRGASAGDRRLRGLAALCVLEWLFWLKPSVRMARFFVGGLGLTGLLVGRLFDKVLPLARTSLPPEGRESARRFAGGPVDPRRWALAAPLIFALSQQAARMIYIQNIHKRPWGYLAGRCSAENYLNGVLADSPIDAYAFVNEKTPPDATVLVFDEFRTFYLDRKFIASTPWDHDYWHELVRESSDPDDLRRRLRGRGVTYMVANDNYLRRLGDPQRPDPWTPEDRAKANRFLKACMQILYYSNSGVWVARVKEAS